MNKPDFPISWPLEKVKAQGAYFYLEATESYLPGNRVNISGRGEMLMMNSYSYLGLNCHSKINEAVLKAIQQYGTGTQGVRLLTGTLDIHKSLEKRISSFKQTESAVTFSSGFMANMSTIPTIVGRGDTVLCDKLDHASILDGARLSEAKIARFRHTDMDHLEHCLKDTKNIGRKLVVVDAVFSMDGTIIPLPEVSYLCKKYGAMLMVDEAHSLGVLGATGHGIEEHFDLPPDSVDIKMGTLSKTIPSVGGYIAGSRSLCERIRHHSRSFIYSAALPPPSAAAALSALSVIEEEPYRVKNLQDNIRYYRSLLKDCGLSYLDNESAIFPIICGDDWNAWNLAKYCQENGVYTQAIPHPIVPKGTARLRIMMTALHHKKDLDYCVSVMLKGAEKLGLLDECRQALKSQTGTGS